MLLEDSQFKERIIAFQVRDLGFWISTLTVQLSVELIFNYQQLEEVYFTSLYP